MKYFNVHPQRQFISVMLIMAILNMTVGCSYFMISPINKKKSVAVQMDELALAAGDPRHSIPQLKKGSYVLIKLKDGSLNKRLFVGSGQDTVYLRTPNDFRSQVVAISDIRYIIKNKAEQKYFILHAGNDTWHLKYFFLDSEKGEVIGEVEPVGERHLLYLNKVVKKSSNRYIPDKSDPTHEVHLYVQGIIPDKENGVSFALTSINKIEIYQSDGATTALISIGVLVGILAIAAIIIAATKSSCPFIYQQTGDGYTFTGEIFGGAIYPSLERDDYLPLPGFIPQDGKYKLKIANELMERQYTNLAELMVINCPENVTALIDQNGLVHTIQKPDCPTEAVSARGNNYMKAISEKDSLSYDFDDSNPDREEVSNLFMTFKKPAAAAQGKLIFTAKNSYWLDYVYGKFTSQFGSSYNQFVKKLRKVPASKLDQWSREQEIPLTVSMKTEKGWVVVDRIKTIGPVASRDMVIALDLAKVKGDDVRIKLESGYRFWEINYAAMDFSDPVSPEVLRISSSSAVDENGKDVTQALKTADDQYLIQPEIGNEVIVTFPSPKGKSKNIVFLHSRGYYEYIRDFKNKPDIAALKSFRKQGAFTRYSKSEYENLMESIDFLPSTTLAEINK